MLHNVALIFVLFYYQPLGSPLVKHVAFWGPTSSSKALEQADDEEDRGAMAV